MTPCKHCGAVPRDDGYGYWSIEHKDVCPLYDEESAQIIAPNEIVDWNLVPRYCCDGTDCTCAGQPFWGEQE